jgi:hypothetical protein
MDGLREGTLDRAAQSTGMMFFGADVCGIPPGRGETEFIIEMESVVRQPQ